jgi:hypothetical protein
MTREQIIVELAAPGGSESAATSATQPVRKSCGRRLERAAPARMSRTSRAVRWGLVCVVQGVRSAEAASLKPSTCDQSRLTTSVDGGLVAAPFDGSARRLLHGSRAVGTTLPALGNQLGRNVADVAAGWKTSAREEWGNRKDSGNRRLAEEVPGWMTQSRFAAA